VIDMFHSSNEGAVRARRASRRKAKDFAELDAVVAKQGTGKIIAGKFS
jgi:hypothetical protein